MLSELSLVGNVADFADIISAVYFEEKALNEVKLSKNFFDFMIILKD